MKKTVILLLVVGMLALLAQAVFAQELSTGTKEVQVAGSIFLNDELSNAWNVLAGYGVFVTPKVKLGVQVDLNGAKDTDTSGFVYAQGDYHFIGTTPSRTIPFAGLDLGFGMSSGDNEFVYGAHAGVKFFLSENKSFNVQYQYLKSTGDNSIGINLILFGLSSYFN